MSLLNRGTQLIFIVEVPVCTLVLFRLVLMAGWSCSSQGFLLCVQGGVPVVQHITTVGKACATPVKDKTNKAGSG